jgi:hypothetical protein
MLMMMFREDHWIEHQFLAFEPLRPLSRHSSLFPLMSSLIVQPAFGSSQYHQLNHHSLACHRQDSGLVLELTH